MAGAETFKRLLIGRSLRTQQLEESTLPKRLALPLFCSDPISSVAYATEEIVLVLAAGGAAYLALSKWVAAAVAALLVIVVASYRQTCRAYPNGGGAFAVSRENFGERTALVAASALLVDYVMTVVVSVVSGVVAITSSAPSLSRHAVAISVGLIVLLTLVNLRGLQQSGRSFAAPTYLFIGLTFVLFAVGAVKGIAGQLPDAATAHQQLHRTAEVGGAFTLLLTLRAFASGCTALTGVEAISNGVPLFRPPRSRNAANTLAIMGALAVSMFVGITILALHLHAHAQPAGTPSVISQVAGSVFGAHALLFFAYQAATAGILILAANTAFSGFPTLASALARANYLPRQLDSRGGKLVFSNGIVVLAVAAAALVIGFHANLDRLIQLYIVGVFTSFTLSQAGMVRHWNRRLRVATSADTRRTKVSRAINGTGAIATGVVLVVVIYSKLTHGAWIAILGMAVLFTLMRAINLYYRAQDREIDVVATDRLVRPSRNHTIVLVSRVQQPTLRAVAYAEATRPTRLEALTVRIDNDATAVLSREWDRHDINVPLVILDSPYRELTRPVIDYIRALPARGPRDVVTVMIPEYVAAGWWEQLLHRQSALRLKARLLGEANVVVTSVAWRGSGRRLLGSG
jgi:amino acid transporter